MVLNIASIADIHGGNRTDPVKLYDQLKEVFMKEVENREIDIIIVCGDLFDSKLAFNDETIIYINKFVHWLYTLNIPIVLLTGTFSHDDRQLLNYSHYINDNFKIITHVTELNIKGLDCLFIPEEYVDKEETYRKYYNRHYDFIFFHGLFDHCNFIKHLNKRSNTSVVFNHADFKAVSGYINGGHIHTSSIYKNVIYDGSFSRDSHGEEEDKGFYIFEYDSDDKKILSKEFIVNHKAEKYITMSYRDLPESLDDITSKLIKLRETIDYLRVEVDLSITDKKYNNILSFLKNDKHVTIKNKKQKIKEQTQVDDTLNEDELKRIKKMDWLDVTVDELKNKHDIQMNRSEINELINTI